MNLYSPQGSPLWSKWKILGEHLATKFGLEWTHAEIEAIQIEKGVIKRWHLSCFHGILRHFRSDVIGSGTVDDYSCVLPQRRQRHLVILSAFVTGVRKVLREEAVLQIAYRLATCVTGFHNATNNLPEHLLPQLAVRYRKMKRYAKSVRGLPCFTCHNKLAQSRTALPRPMLSHRAPEKSTCACISQFFSCQYRQLKNCRKAL